MVETATTYKQALDDLLYLTMTHPPGCVCRASILDANIKVLVQQNLEILSLSSSPAQTPVIDDLAQLALVRSRLKLRDMPLSQIDEAIEQTIEAIAQSDKKHTISDLKATLQAREHLVRDTGFNLGGLDEVILGILQRMQKDAADMIMVS